MKFSEPRANRYSPDLTHKLQLWTHLGWRKARAICSRVSRFIHSLKRMSDFVLTFLAQKSWWLWGFILNWCVWTWRKLKPKSSLNFRRWMSGLMNSMPIQFEQVLWIADTWNNGMTKVLRKWETFASLRTGTFPLSMIMRGACMKCWKQTSPWTLDPTFWSLAQLHRTLTLWCQ